MNDENKEQYISDEALNLIKMVDDVIRDHNSGLPVFMFESDMYHDFILPLSVALVSQSGARTVKDILNWCVHIDRVAFATVDPGVYYPQKAYLLRRKLNVNELNGKSSVLWDLNIPVIKTDGAYINVLVAVYKDIPIASNLLQNMGPDTLKNFLMEDVKSRIRALISCGNSNQYVSEMMRQSLNYISDNFPNVMLEDIRNDLRDILNHYLNMEDKNEKMIEGIAVIMKELRIFGIGTDETDIGL